MGLDTVELVIEVEERFGIRIRDEDAEKIQTAGQLRDYVLMCISSGASTYPNRPIDTVCLTAAAFYRIRRGLMSVAGVPREAIRPGANTASLLPQEGRRAAWTALSETLQLTLPRLTRPAWLTCWLTLAVLTSAAGTVVAAMQWVPAPDAVVLGVLQLMLLGLLAGYASRPFARIPYRDAQTIGGLVWNVAALNATTLLQAYDRPVEQEVWEILKLLIIEHLGVPAEDVTPDASWVNDFRCD